MIVVNNRRSFSQKQIRKYRTRKYLVVFIILIVSIGLVLFAIRPILENQKSPSAESLVIGFLMVLGAFTAFISLWLFKKIDELLDKLNVRIGIATAGDNGERLVYDELKKVLDNNYTVYPNYIIPGHKFDIDFLIVGPKGIIIVEVKNFSNSTFFSQDKALSIKGLGFKKEITELIGSSDPRIKIEKYCKILDNYLNYLNFNNINIRKVLVFTKASVAIEGRSNIYIVKKTYELGKYFNSLYPDDKFTPEFCKEMNDKLLIN